MKRDMELVRRILIDVADSDLALDASVFTDERNGFQAIAYHFDIMNEAGLLDANVRRGLGDEYVFAEARALTWKGQDFLASIAPEKVWAEMKMTIAKRLGDATFATIKALAEEMAKKLLMV